MASIEKRAGKNGDSYRITVSAGYTKGGKKVKHTKTWTPDPGMSEKKIAKTLQRVATDFERDIELGYQTDNRQTFSEYAAYVLDLKKQQGVKTQTIDFYQSMMERTNMAIGHMKLCDIRPQHLNNFYRNLQENGLRKGAAKAIAKPALQKARLDQHMSQDALAKKAGVASNTIRTMENGSKVMPKKAEAVAAALGNQTSDLFTLEKDMTPLAPKTVDSYHRFISTVLAQAEREMLVPYNAAAKAVPPKLEHKEPNYFQPEEINAILEALETEPLKWRTIVLLLIVTGCRRGEIMGLQWERVSLALRTIKIDHALLYSHTRGIYLDTTKTADVRFLKIPQEAVDLLEQWKQEQTAMRFASGSLWHETGFVFTQEDGRPMNPDSITKWLNQFSKRHNLPRINPHAFRHTVASVLIANGTDVVTVSKQLGHASTTTTEGFYAHLIEERKAEASDCIADVLLRGGERSQNASPTPKKQA